MSKISILTRHLISLWLLLIGSFGGAFLLPSVICRTRWSTFHRGDTSQLVGQHRTPVLFSVRNYRQVASAQPVTQGVDGKKRWFPRAPKVVYDDDIYGAAHEEEEEDNHDGNGNIEERAVKLLARLLKEKLEDVEVNIKDSETATIGTNIASDHPHAHLVKGRFIDLTCAQEGERILEALFLQMCTKEEDPQVIQAAVMALQSILVLGTQVGVKGSPIQLEQMVAHLDSRGNQNQFLMRDLETWDTSSVRRLKYQQMRDPGIEVLAELKWKRNTQGAFDLLVAIGAWGKHEDLALLRSGFSLRFNDKELQAAEDAAASTFDLDNALGLRQDLRHLKVLTIDSADTSEIDDGLSLEKYTSQDGLEKQRIWIHIADAERWAPRTSELYDIARQRVTSLYLPGGSIPMLPPKASDDLMSLTVNKDAYALSLGVELHHDGSIDDSTLVITPSLIRVSYRLTYVEVDEMLEEGIGYNEEWELGALLAIATTRRKYRITRGSTEGFVPRPIPQRLLSISHDTAYPDGVKIDVTVQATHNSGLNGTTGAEISDTFFSNHGSSSSHVEPVSSAFTLVTETMILAGEAIAKWKLLQEESLTNGDGTGDNFRNMIRLPFRVQRNPDYTSRTNEKEEMISLLESNAGDGYCHAWYSRRFLSGVKVMEACAPHAGLGLSGYVQWTSPIRRYSDLMVHCMVKRFLRRQKIRELIVERKSLEGLNLTAGALGCRPPLCLDSEYNEYQWNPEQMDEDIDFSKGAGLMGAARTLQRLSEQYWLFEYIRRLHSTDPDKSWDALVLGFAGIGDKGKKQYAIYIYELGLEHKFSSPIDLSSGMKLRLRVALINPRAGQLAFVRTNC